MAKASKQIIQQHEEMFYPTVRVRTKKAGGSGTVVYSESYKDEVYTYIITNQHVIDDSVTRDIVQRVGDLRPGVRTLVRRPGTAEQGNRVGLPEELLGDRHRLTVLVLND